MTSTETRPSSRAEPHTAKKRWVGGLQVLQAPGIAFRAQLRSCCLIPKHDSSGHPLLLAVSARADGAGRMPHAPITRFGILYSPD